MVTSDYQPIFGPSPSLPKGPHALTRDEVAASQRARLLAAVAHQVGDRGYAETTVTAIVKRAGVSAATFYEHFDDKLECYLAAYDAFAAELLARIATPLDPNSEWDAFIATALGAYLSTLEENPVVARAFLVEIDAAGRAARDRRKESYGNFAMLIKQRHEQIRSVDPELGPLPDRAYHAVVFGVRELAAEALEAEERPALARLAPDIVLWIDALIRGAAAAERALADANKLS
jgi:AcrR family transcriptional regulator